MHHHITERNLLIYQTIIVLRVINHIKSRMCTKIVKQWVICKVVQCLLNLHCNIKQSLSFIYYDKNIIRCLLFSFVSLKEVFPACHPNLNAGWNWIVIWDRLLLFFIKRNWNYYVSVECLYFTSAVHCFDSNTHLVPSCTKWL